MRRLFAVFWLIVIVAAAGHVGWRFDGGMPFQTDLMALLPVEDHDPAVARAKEVMVDRVSRQVVVLVGHQDRAVARGAASALGTSLEKSGVLSLTVPDPAAVARLGAAYFPYRAGLLADADRRLLLENRGEDILNRALSRIYGFVGLADSRLLTSDPFLLFPEFLKALPGAAGKTFYDDGLLTLNDNNIVWGVVSGQLAGDPFALAFQKRFQQAWGTATAGIRDTANGPSILRLGTIFHAQAGASEALSEASTIALCSLVGAVALMLLAFRSVGPLLLSVLSVVVGLLIALSVSLLAFGRPHVSVLLFGAGLIGVTVDYSVHYFTQVFSPRTTPLERLRHVLPGLVLGAGTTLIGYVALAIAPYPGLRQVAVFSGIGVAASLLTVFLWFPLLDRVRPSPLPDGWRRFAAQIRRLWTDSGARGLRLTGGIAALAVGIAGLATMTTDDDVRRQQNLSPRLVAEQADVLRLTGFDTSGQFFLVEGANAQESLVREEALAARLGALVKTGTLAGWQSPASFVPSIPRQRENRRLIEEQLEQPYLAALRDRLGMTTPATEKREADFLRLVPLREAKLLPFLDALILQDGAGGTAHVVALKGVGDPAAVGRAGDNLPGVRFVDPTADVTVLLGKYRRQTMWLLGASALLMVPILALRHGFLGGLRIMAPPVAAVILAPALLSLLGIPFTFFAAMALVLVLSIGVDYAVFCAEDTRGGDDATLVAVTLAALTTMLSFGLLAFSRVAAVHTFGMTMLVGIVLAFLAAPGAAPRRPKQEMLEVDHRVV